MKIMLKTRKETNLVSKDKKSPVAINVLKISATMKISKSTDTWISCKTKSIMLWKGKI